MLGEISLTGQRATARRTPLKGAAATLSRTRRTYATSRDPFPLWTDPHRKQQAGAPSPEHHSGNKPKEDMVEILQEVYEAGTDEQKDDLVSEVLGSAQQRFEEADSGVVYGKSPLEKFYDSMETDLVSPADHRLTAPSQTGRPPLLEMRRKQPAERILVKEIASNPALTEYISKLTDAIQLEREFDEKEAIARLAATNPDPANGLSLFGVKLERQSLRELLTGPMSSDPAIRFRVLPSDGSILPRHEFKTGMQVWITHSKAVVSEGEISRVEGYVYSTKGKELHIQVKPADCINLGEEGTFRIDEAFNDVVYQRMLDAVDKVRIDIAAQIREQKRYDDQSAYADGSKRTSLILSGTHLTDLTVPKLPPLLKKWESDLFTPNQHLNSWIERHLIDPPIAAEGDPLRVAQLNAKQRQAIAYALRYRITLIQGPPGTGKSATVAGTVHLLKHYHKISLPILICAPTHAAVDHLTASMAEKGLTPLRIGHSTKIREDCQQYSYAQREQLHPDYDNLANARSDVDGITYNLKYLKLDPLKKVDWTKIEDNKQQIGSKGGSSLVARELLDEYEGLLAMRKTIDDFYEDLAKKRQKVGYLSHKIREDLFNSSDVVLCTAMGASSKILDAHDWPLVFLDEAAQCNHATSLIPIMRACQQLVLIGDHKQLQSICKSDAAREKGFTRSLFEDLMEKTHCPRIMLEEQYRMAPDIVAFSNSAFYEGKLKTPRNLQIAPVRSSYAVPGRNVVFLDHQHSESRTARSKQNIGESQIIADILADLFEKNHGLRGSDIGIIAPYTAQTELLRDISGLVASKLPHRLEDAQSVEIKTVDGFQGREKQVVVISTVRSNEIGQIGFLDNPRRLNVALTRAKSLMLIVGNKSTLAAKDPTWQSFVKLLDSEQLIRPWWNSTRKYPSLSKAGPLGTRSAEGRSNKQRLEEVNLQDSEKPNKRAKRAS